MRLSDSSPSRQSLEQSLEKLILAPDAVRPLSRKRGAWVQPFLNKLFNFLAGIESVQIQQRCDRSGSTYWLVYDPYTRSNQRFDTEQEIRIWLEQRYRQ